MFGGVKYARRCTDIAAQSALSPNENFIAVLIGVSDKASEPVSAITRVRHLDRLLSANQTGSDMHTGPHIQNI